MRAWFKFEDRSQRRRPSIPGAASSRADGEPATPPPQVAQAHDSDRCQEHPGDHHQRKLARRERDGPSLIPAPRRGVAPVLVDDETKALAARL